MRPKMPLGSPGLREISFHVSPPSVVFHKPLSAPPLSKLYGVRLASQMAAYSTFGFDGSMLKSTAPALFDLNSTRCQVWPPSFERKTPRCSFVPVAWPSAATYTRSGFFG